MLMMFEKNDPDFSYFVKEYGNSPVFFVGFFETNKYQELSRALINTTSVNLKFFLKKIKKDIDTFESLNREQKKSFSFF